MTDNSQFYNKEAEQLILSLMIQWPDKITSVTQLMRPDFFYVTDNKVIYKALLEMDSANDSIDLVLLTDHLHKKYGTREMKERLYASYVTSIANISPTKHLLTAHAELITECYKLRKLKDLADKTSDLIQKGATSGDIITDMEDDIHELVVGSKISLSTPADIIETLIKETERNHTEQGITGIPSGLYSLDSHLGGFQAGCLYVIAGRPGMGKTALLMTFLDHLGSLGGVGLNISYEAPLKAFTSRLICMNANVSIRQLKSGDLDVNEWKRIFAAEKRIKSYKIYVDDTYPSLSGIRGHAKKLKSKGGLDIVSVDYLQLMEGGRGDDREGFISSMSRGLKKLAMELEIPVIALSQLNRGLENRDNKRPRLHDLRSSGAIEQDADVVLLIYRDKYYNTYSTSEVTEVDVAKYREGAQTVINLKFKEDQVKFIDTVEWR